MEKREVKLDDWNRHNFARTDFDVLHARENCHCMFNVTINIELNLICIITVVI